MPSITVSLDGVLDRYAAEITKLGASAPIIMHTALLAATPAMKEGLASALVPQTGLQPGTTHRAVKVQPGVLSVTFAAYGGNISLKHFHAHETATGVSAAPWNRRSIYAGSFLRAGWWPKRVDKPNWNGQAFYRAGGRTSTGKAKFTKAKSGLFIPDELLKGATIAAWERGVGEIQASVEAQIAKLLP